MGSDARQERVVMRVKNGNTSIVKKTLEDSGIIYAEEDGEVCFSVLPAQRMEDFHRAKELFLSASR